MKKELVNNYLKTIGYFDEIVNIDDINKLMRAHVNTFAFSSLKVLLKEDISLDLEDIYESIVLKKRGGYCFEHNKLFYEVLKSLGFDVVYYLARVVNNMDNIVPQTHRFTLLNYKNEQYLLDVGIGFRTPCVAVKFGKDISTNHLGYNFKIEKIDDNTYGLEILDKDDVFIATKFDLNKCYEADFEMGHFYSHKNPCAVFVNNLVLSLITKDEIRSLRNSDYFKIYENAQEKIEIKSLNMFQKILKEEFNVDFQDKELELLYKEFVIEV